MAFSIMAVARQPLRRVSGIVLRQRRPAREIQSGKNVYKEKNKPRPVHGNAAVAVAGSCTVNGSRANFFLATRTA